MNNDEEQARLMARQLRELVRKLQVMGRNDLLLQAITVPTLEQLRTEAARGTLRRLFVKDDGRLFLEGDKTTSNGNNNTIEVQLSPVHRAVYLLFLRHKEGIEFKRLSEYHDELLSIYDHICPEGDKDKMRETVERLTNPLDNAINEKCSRIKSAFTSLMDDYSASYYIISSQSEQIDPTSPMVPSSQSHHLTEKPGVLLRAIRTYALKRTQIYANRYLLLKVYEMREPSTKDM